MQAGAGVEMHAKPGDAVTRGAPLLTLHTDTPERFEAALAELAGDALTIGSGDESVVHPTVLDRIA